MARSGPVTKDTSTVPLGLAQIRIGASASNIGQINPVLTASDSIGALANTKYVGDAEFWKLESGFPLLEDTVIPLRMAAALECAFKEVTPYNMAMAHGIDPTDGSYTLVHSGEVPLGVLTTPDYIRMEALYTFPNGSNYMDIIFPRAQVIGTIEVDFQAEDSAAVPVRIEAKRADSEVSGGHAVWDAKPLGRIMFR